MSQTSQGDLASSQRRDQFEYAWRWFDMHARQRVLMFNFFLLAAGAIANAYGLLFREQLYGPAAAVALIGLIVSLVAYVLDVRNHQLVDMGEEALKQVEKDYLSPIASETETQPGFAILSRETHPYFWQKHKFLIRGLEAVAALGYLAAGIHSAIMLFRC